jgi:hypothetical protein
LPKVRIPLDQHRRPLLPLRLPLLLVHPLFVLNLRQTLGDICRRLLRITAAAAVEQIRQAALAAGAGWRWTGREREELERWKKKLRRELEEPRRGDSGVSLVLRVCSSCGCAGGVITSWPKVSERRKVISGGGGDKGGFWGADFDAEDFSVRSSRLCRMSRSEGILTSWWWFCRSAGVGSAICTAICDAGVMRRAWRCRKEWINLAEIGSNSPGKVEMFFIF